jgi:hypothetical protein
MKARRMYHLNWLRALGLVTIMIALTGMGCGGGGGGGGESQADQGGDNGTERIYVSVADYIKDIEVTANQPTEIKFTYELASPSQAYTAISIDLQETLDSVSVNVAGLNKSNPLGFLANLVSVASAATEAQVTARIGYAEDVDTVCQTGSLYGPFTITGTTQPETIDPPTISAEPSALSVINTGSFVVCLEVVSPVNAIINVDEVAVDVTPCEETPADFSGTWTGTYSCTNVGCPDDENVPITLTVTQDGHSAHYTDDQGGSFQGTVCGNVFRFNGTGPGYRESGTLTLTGEDKATKTATWVADDNSCKGDCTDNLARE